MKLSLLLTSALAGLTFAAPAEVAERDAAADYGRGGGWGKWWGGGRGFTSTYSVKATPNQVANASASGGFYFTGGLPGCVGYYDFGLNSKTNEICYHIRLYGFRGKYESAADTATHIHEAPYGQTGPPRIAFPNPRKTGKGDERVSKGCMKGPFMTGITDPNTGKDTGAGFNVKRIEKNPPGFFCDVHSSLAIPGAVRGQLG